MRTNYRLLLWSPLWDCQEYSGEGIYTSRQSLREAIDRYKKDEIMDYKFIIQVPQHLFERCKKFFPEAWIRKL